MIVRLKYKGEIVLTNVLFIPLIQFVPVDGRIKAYPDMM